MLKRLLLLFCWGVAQAQTSLTDFSFDTPVGAKRIDLGFASNEFINTSTVQASDYLWIRWEPVDDAVGYRIYVGVPKIVPIAADFGLTPLSWFSETQLDSLNFISPRDLGTATAYLVYTAKFDWVVRVAAYGQNRETLAVSQIRFIRQQREK